MTDAPRATGVASSHEMINGIRVPRAPRRPIQVSHISSPSPTVAVHYMSRARWRTGLSGRRHRSAGVRCKDVALNACLPGGVNPLIYHNFLSYQRGEPEV